MTRTLIFSSLIIGLLAGASSTAIAKGQVRKHVIPADCAGAMCRAQQHPRPRALKPIPCVPLRFDQWQAGTVTMRIDYTDGRPSVVDSKPAGVTGQFCRGESIWKGGSVELCNDAKSADLNKEEVEKGLVRSRARTGRFGWLVTLKGAKYGGEHGART